jgi:hypothetical protein
MLYLFLAYAVFWGITFALVLSVFVRQKATERELTSIKRYIEQETDKRIDQAQG